MAVVVRLANNAKVENVTLVAIGIFHSAIEAAGANCQIRNVNCATSGSETPQILVSGDDAYLEGVTVGLSIDAGILVTGDRATLVGVVSSFCGFTTGDGVRFDTSADSVLTGYRSYQDAFGLRVVDSPRLVCSDITIRDPFQRGVVWDGSNNGMFSGLVSDAGEHGVQITDSSSNRFKGQIVDAGKDTTNTYDGILVDGDSNRNHLEFTVSYSWAGNQMRYGLNISAATCDVNVESSILTGAGSTANFNDAGTGTVLTDEHIV